MFSKTFSFLYFLCLVNLGQSGNTFEFDFNQSSVKVVVQDVFGLVEYKVVKDGEIIQKVILGSEAGGAIRGVLTEDGLVVTLRGVEIEFRIDVDESNYSQFSVLRRNLKKATVDCVDLDGRRQVNWYGRNQQPHQVWPIQKYVLKHSSYVTNANGLDITERYWLNSNGLYFYIDGDVPLFVDQNNEYVGFMCFEAKIAPPYDTRRKSFDFTYKVGVGQNAREAHLRAVNRHLKKPTSYPLV